MAGLPWFKLASDFPGHPKTLRLCSLLGDPNAGMYVVRLLAYCASYAPDGRIPLDMLAHAAGWRKQRVAPEFLASSLETAGFLVCTETHAEIHDWDVWNGAHARKCAKDNARPRSDYRVPRAGTSRELRGNLSGSRAGDVEGEGEKTEKKQLPPSPSVAVRGAEAPPAAGAGAEVHHIRRRAAPRPADPRHHPLQLALEAAFRQARHEDYGFDGRDARAIKSLLCKSKGDTDEVVRRFVVGLGSDYKERVDSIWDLDQRWNALSRPTNGVPAPRRELK